MTFADLIAWACGGSIWRFIGVWALITSPIACLANAKVMITRRHI